MAEKIPTEEYRRIFTELSRGGQFRYVLAVIHEEYTRWRGDLESHLQQHLLVSPEVRAEPIAIQGALKALAELNDKLVELAVPKPAPGD